MLKHMMRFLSYVTRNLKNAERNCYEAFILPIEYRRQAFLFSLLHLTVSSIICCRIFTFCAKRKVSHLKAGWTDSAL